MTFWSALLSLVPLRKFVRYDSPTNRDLGIGIWFIVGNFGVLVDGVYSVPILGNVIVGIGICWILGNVLVLVPWSVGISFGINFRL